MKEKIFEQEKEKQGESGYEYISIEKNDFEFEIKVRFHVKSSRTIQTRWGEMGWQLEMSTAFAEDDDEDERLKETKAMIKDLIMMFIKKETAKEKEELLNAIIKQLKRFYKLDKYRISFIRQCRNEYIDDLIRYASDFFDNELKEEMTEELLECLVESELLSVEALKQKLITLLMYEKKALVITKDEVVTDYDITYTVNLEAKTVEGFFFEKDAKRIKKAIKEKKCRLIQAVRYKEKNLENSDMMQNRIVVTIAIEDSTDTYELNITVVREELVEKI